MNLLKKTQILNNCKKNINDEFYTQYKDVEKNLKFFEDCFVNKHIYMPCDYYKKSSFYKFFKNNFYRLQLKKISCSNFKNKEDVDSFYVEFDGKNETVIKLQNNGDFLNKENEKFYKECDIVITNPPFSLIKKFYPLLKKLEKQFIFIGPVLCMSYVELLKDFSENKIYYKNQDGDIKYLKSDGTYKSITSIFVNNVKQVNLPNLNLTKEYNTEEYKKFDLYSDIINVDYTVNIPKNYAGKMGVPITFLLKYKKEQFKILGKLDKTQINGKHKFKRIIIQHV